MSSKGKQHDRYCDTPNLFSQHHNLMVRDDYPDQDRWLEHLEHDLMRFWLKPEACDMSKGLWRSFLTDDGRALPGLDNSKSWPPELRRAIAKTPDGKYSAEAGSLLEGPDNNANHNFVRSHSRQTFAYGIAYHMTGKEEYFQLCRQGAHALMDLVDNNGSMYTRQKLKNGEWIKDAGKRTSQDLAYGMTGIAFYYYLTHDAKALKKILKLKKFIFGRYYHPGKDVITWLPAENNEEGQSVELVSHLDQLYAYMLWLAPALPAPHKQEFMDDMGRIVGMMLEHFYSEVHGTFWGAGNTPEMMVLGGDHTDFGHSVKAMWVIYQVGVWTKNLYYMNFARRKIHKILGNAFDQATGAWNRRFLPNGELDHDKEWWSLAELDQASAILALKDPSYLQYINRSYAFWFNNMVDHKNGEIWHVLDGKTLTPRRIFPKAHCWKNSLHSFEHALVGYLTSRQLLKREMPLHYAFKSLDEVKYQIVTPYIFKGNIVGKEQVRQAEGLTPTLKDGDNVLMNLKVTFDSLH